MNIYTRYVLKQVGFRLFFLLIAGTIIIFLGFISKIISEGLPLGIICRLIKPFFISSIAYSMPIASAFAAALATSKMVQRHEIIAFRAVGIPLWRVIFPVFVVMTLLCVLWVKINDLTTSKIRVQMNQEIVQSVENMILSQLRKNQSFTDPNNQFTIKVADVSENGELLFLEFQHKKGNCRVRAEKGKLEFKRSDDGKSILSIALVNAEVENTEKQIKSIWAGEKQMDLPLQDVFHKQDRVDPSLTQIQEAIADLKVERAFYHRQMAAQLSFSLLCGNVAETSVGKWQHRLGRENYLQRQYNIYRVVSPRIWSNSFAALFFMYAVIPLLIFCPNMKIGRLEIKESLTMFLHPFVVIFIGYAVYNIFYSNAKGGDVHPYFVWSGNIVLGMIGSYFWSKIG